MTLHRRAAISILMPPGTARDSVVWLASSYGWETSLIQPEQLQTIPHQRWNLVIIGDDFPNEDTTSIAARAACDPRTRVMVISENENPRHAADVLLSGSDDYLVYPFEPAECIARINALITRSGHTEGRTMSMPGPTIDRGSRSIIDHGLRVQFSPREWSILMALIDSPGRSVSTSALSNMIWGDDAHLHTVASVVNRMRRKLTAYGVTSVGIRTIRNKGYAIHMAGHSGADLT